MDVRSLRTLLEVLRESGVTEYRDERVSLKLAAPAKEEPTEWEIPVVPHGGNGQSHDKTQLDVSNMSMHYGEAFAPGGAPKGR